MSTIDERGRAAAASLRRAMDEDFDVEAGLALVQAEQVVVRLPKPEPPRRLRMFATAAAVTVGLVGVGMVALRDRDRVDINDTPTVPTTTPTSMPTTSTVPDESTQTTVEPAPPTTSESVPATTSSSTGTVIVADVVQMTQPVRASIASLGFGSGAGQLAVESAQQSSDPARPWAPVQLADGRVLIADTANGRWVVIEPSPSDNADAASMRTTEVPWPDGVLANAEPVVDDAGSVYALMVGTLGVDGTRTGELWVLDPSDLATPVSTHPATSIGNSRIELTPTQVIIDGAVIDGLTPVLGTRPAVEYIAPDPLASPSGTRFRVVWDGVTTTFAYAPEELPSYFGPMPALADGSVMIFVYLDGSEFVDRLTPDGQVHRLQLPPAGSVFAAGSVAQSGFLRLEIAGNPPQWELLHYDLP